MKSKIPRLDIIRMAHEAGFLILKFDGEDEVMEGDGNCFQTDEIERFASLVAAHEREEFEAKLIEKVASNTWSFQPTKWVGLDEYIKNRFQERIKEENQTDLEIMAMVEHFLKVNNSGVGD
jgi:hypothetical protein